MRLRGILTLILAAGLGATPPAAPANPSPPSRPEVLRVGLEPDAPPLSSRADDGSPRGFAKDIAQAAAERSGMQVEFVMLPWAELQSEFLAGRIDALGAVAYAESREQELLYSIPYGTLRAAIFLHRDVPPPSDASDLKRLRFAAPKDSRSHLYLMGMGLGENIRETADVAGALLLLDHGEVDAVIGTHDVVENYIRERRLRNIKAVAFEPVEHMYRLHLGVRLDRPDLLFRLNNGLAALLEDGTQAELHARWLAHLLRRRAPGWADLAPWLLGAAALGLAGGVIILRQRRLIARIDEERAAARENRELLDFVLTGSQDGYWHYNFRDQSLIRNERWYSMLGYKPGDVPATHEGWISLVHPDDQAAEEELARRVAAGELAEIHRETRLRAADGAWRWVLIRGRVLQRDAAGRAVRIAGTHTDITDRLRILEEARRSQRLLEQSEDAAGIGGWEVDLATKRSFWSRQVFRIYGLDPAGTPPGLEEALAVYPPESKERLLPALDALTTRGEPFTLDLAFRNTAGRRLFVRAIGRADVGADGVVTRIYGSIQDITEWRTAEEERKRFQAKMLETQKLESLGILAGGIAHDFNNLLTVVLGNASLLREAEPRLLENIHPIEQAANRAAELCRQMLAYAGQVRMNPERLSLGALIESSQPLLGHSISKNVRLETQLAKDLPQVEADPQQVRQILVNLVTNASEACGGSPGLVRVSVAAVDASREDLSRARVGDDLPAGRYVRLEVSDTGSGMNVDTLSRILDPFFTTKFTGRGLGLPAVAGIARIHRAALIITSEPGLGTRVSILFPALAPIPSPMAGSPGAPTPGPAQAGGTVLVVDDEPAVRSLAEAMLRRQGFATEAASSGEEALALARNRAGRYVAALIDLTMPGMDGPTTLRAIRNLNPKLPAVLTSGLTEREVAADLSEDPPTVFLHKPFTLAELAFTIGRASRRMPGA
jgi:two-component system, cell cycle sensor histidine kinase and response regulator CckA